MKIVIVPSWYSSSKAPSRAPFVRGQAQLLAERGHSVTVIVPDRDGAYPIFRVRSGWERGMNHLRIALPWPWHRLLGFYCPSSVSRIIRRLICGISPDVVHAHAVRPGGVLAAIAMQGTGLPLCITEHSSPLPTFWMTWHGYSQIQRCYSKADRILAVSNALRREMASLFPGVAERVETVYNGIDTGVFAPQCLPPRQDRVLFVGGLIPRKGVDVLLSVVKILEHRPVMLSIVGEGPLKVDLQEQARRLGINRRIHWHGPALLDQMPALYAAHDLVVVPSHHETFSMVSAEALACGRPVVATRCGGPEEVVPSFGGILVTVGDAPEMARAINRVLDGGFPFDHEMAVRYVREKFSLTALVERLETIYREMRE